MGPDPVQERFARHLAFWNLDDMDRPLLGATVDIDTALMDPIIHEVADEGDILRPGQWLSLSHLDRAEDHWRQLEGVGADLFKPVGRSSLTCMPKMPGNRSSSWRVSCRHVAFASLSTLTVLRKRNNWFKWQREHGATETIEVFINPNQAVTKERDRQTG